MVLRYAKERVT